MIRIITIDREYGSGGGVIAEQLAARLGWKVWDQRLTDEIARRLDCERRAVEEREERKDPAYYRLFKAFLRGSFEGTVNAPRLKLVDADCIRDTAQAIVKELAEAGDCVIVGRGGAYYLGDRSDAFHVFIYGLFDDKVRRLRATGKSEKEAVTLVEQVDVDRASFIQRYFDVAWPERQRYHLMINSSMGEELAAEAILDAVARMAKPRT
ncbi:MAG TPA: cytidylate kinase-like family protein [Candidatus Angelobacter sp.]